jgi:alkaline phosphatase
MKMRFKELVFIFIIAFVAGCADAGKPHSNNLAGFKHSPKNVVIFIADGAGFNHFRSADYYQCGRIPCQPYEYFPVKLAMTTYPAGGGYDANAARADFDYVKKGCTDSAAAATAMATGVKTHNTILGMDVNGHPVLNLVERAEQLGKATGVITSVPFSDVTPAGFVVHDGSRSNLSQIAEDMINKSAVDVIMGCGHPLYNTDGKPDKAPHYKYIDKSTWTGLASGSAGGDADGDGVPDHWTLVQTRAEFRKLAAGPTPRRVFGIAQVFETLQEDRSGDAHSPPYKVPLTQTVPTLEEMTSAALNVLDEDPDGFFLMVEGGAVDWASHNNHSGRLVEEMNDFNKSINVVLSWVEKNSSWGQTLVIITADHETGCLTGSPRRSPSAKPGPGSGLQPTGSVWNELVSNGTGNLPTMEWHSTSHTNSLVPFFAKGSGAQLFKDTIDGLDHVRGPYIDNTDLANVIFSLWTNTNQ